MPCLRRDSEPFGQTKRQESLLEQDVDVSLDVKKAAKSLHRIFELHQAGPERPVAKSA